MTSLTPENARPGLRVKCVVEDFARAKLKNGETYRITRKHNESLVVLDGFSPFDYFLMERFVLAEPARPTLRALLAEHDPEFLAAVCQWGREAHLRYKHGGNPGYLVRDLLSAIERANLHAPAEVQAPGVTDARATLDLEWWA